MNDKTLINADCESDEYLELRFNMVHRLVDCDLDADHGSLMALLEELVTEMYQNMDDDSLQNHYDTIFGICG